MDIYENGGTLQSSCWKRNKRTIQTELRAECSGPRWLLWPLIVHKDKGGRGGGHYSSTADKFPQGSRKQMQPSVIWLLICSFLPSASVAQRNNKHVWRCKLDVQHNNRLIVDNVWATACGLRLPVSTGAIKEPVTATLEGDDIILASRYELHFRDHKGREILMLVTLSNSKGTVGLRKQAQTQTHQHFNLKTLNLW